MRKTNRIRIAREDIIATYTQKALDEGVSIPSTTASIIDDAYARGWVKTAMQRAAEADAKL